MTTVYLYLCETPFQARDIGRVLGARRKGEGYIEDGPRTVVTGFAPR